MAAGSGTVEQEPVTDDSMLDSQSSSVSESGRSTEYVIQDGGTSDSDGVQTSSLERRSICRKIAYYVWKKWIRKCTSDYCKMRFIIVALLLVVPWTLLGLAILFFRLPVSCHWKALFYRLIRTVYLKCIV